jgi:predicted ArsR family transcriptional regulator
MERLLTTKEVADELGCKPKKVRQLVGAGALQAENISPGMSRPTYRFDPEYVEAFRMKQRIIKDVPQRMRAQPNYGDKIIQFF